MPALFATLTALALAEPLQVAFGSCAHQRHRQPIWWAIRDAGPDLMVLLGDAVYVDSDRPSAYPRAWRRLAAKPGLRALREQTPLTAVWDDHDYGANDAGAGWPLAPVARQALLDFLEAPPDDPRRTAELYVEHLLGDPERPLRVLLLDTRSARSPLRQAGSPAERQGQGPYLPTRGPGARMLSPAQWDWLEERLRQPALLTVVVSTIPVLPYFTGWETWANLPDERDRLLAALDQSPAPTVIVSGDTHWGELSVWPAPPRRWELTTSGLTQTWKAPADNALRHGSATYVGPNFGWLEVDPDGDAARLELRDQRGRPVFGASLALWPAAPAPQPAAENGP
jgi:alkaline phosphatase D